MKKKKLVLCFYTALAVCAMAMAGCAGAPGPMGPKQIFPSCI